MRLVPEIWVEWARFVARPRLPAQRVRFDKQAVGEVARLLLLNVMVALPLATVLTGLAKAQGLKTPEFEVLISRGPLFTLLIGALIIPLFEELVFRGWLSGRRWHLAVAAVVIALGAILFGLVRVVPEGLGLIGALVGAVVLAVIAGWWLARRVGSGVPHRFERAFPWLFFASSLAFGLAHMSNYPLDRPWLLLPFVLPQLFAGTIFGFARVRYGMWANIALHAGGNGLFLGLSLAGG
jgi:membrane protease YdiL (CAAX protease family)